ncbi:MAG: EamA family transporter, partial [Alistipes sp.]|nr:EamA family transporter [Alistipes sp.]
MWLTLAFTSAALLGFYDAAKKTALTDNAVLPVLLLNTLFSTLIFLPTILAAECGLDWFDGTVLKSTSGDLHAHGLVLLKSAIVLTSWIFGYFGMKHLPITIVGPINATRPVMVLVGAMLVLGERL